MEGRLLVKDCTLLDAGLSTRTGRWWSRPGWWRASRPMPTSRCSPVTGPSRPPGGSSCQAAWTGTLASVTSPGRGVCSPRRSRPRCPPPPSRSALRGGVTTVLEQVEGVDDGGAALDGRFHVTRALGMRLVASLAAGEVAASPPTSSMPTPPDHRRPPPGTRRARIRQLSRQPPRRAARAVGRDAEALRAPVHFRLAETSAELAEHFEQHRVRMVERLDRHALLGPPPSPPTRGRWTAPRRSGWPRTRCWWRGARWQTSSESSTASSPCGSRRTGWSSRAPASADLPRAVDRRTHPRAPRGAHRTSLGQGARARGPGGRSGRSSSRASSVAPRAASAPERWRTWSWWTSSPRRTIRSRSSPPRCARRSPGRW